MGFIQSDGDIVTECNILQMQFIIILIHYWSYTPLQQSWKGGILVSPCQSVCPSIMDEIVSALYLPQYSLDPFHFYTSYQPTSEAVSCVELFLNSKIWMFAECFYFRMLDPLLGPLFDLWWWPSPVIPPMTLTHWGRDQIDAIFQTTFSNAFSWMKMCEFRLRFHWSLFLRV